MVAEDRTNNVLFGGKSTEDYGDQTQIRHEAKPLSPKEAKGY